MRNKPSTIDPADIALYEAAYDIPVDFDPKAKTAAAIRLESQGWETWLRTLAPASFTAPFADEHIEFWNLFWSILQRKAAGEEIPEDERNLCLFLSRGLGKSTSAEMAAIAEGCVLNHGLCLYLCDTQLLAEEHLYSVKAILETPTFARYYPAMSRPKMSQTSQERDGSGAKRQAKFTQDTIICENGWAMTARGIMSNVRGGRVGATRFTLVVLDDVDSLNDSLMVIEKKKRIISRTVYPAMSKDGITILAQNLITKNSFASQVVNRKTDILSNRTVIGGGPVKAFQHLELKSETLPNGQVRWLIDACVPTWPHFNITDARNFLGKSGKEAFLAEYQHEFESKQGRVIPEYNEAAQIITWSAFERMFGVRYILPHWKAAVGHDRGYSDGMHPHYAAWVFIAVAAMNGPLAGKHFVYRGRDFVRTSIDDQAKEVWKDLAPDPLTGKPAEYVPGEGGLIKEWQISHEATGEMLTLNQQHKMPFGKFKHWGKMDGIAQWNNMSICDHSIQNPFNEDVQATDGTWLLGCPNLFYIVDDDQKESPRDHRGLKLMREQISGWEYVPVEITRTGLTEEQPSKVNDDYCDPLKSLLKWFGMDATPLTAYEEYQRKLAAMLPDRMKDEHGRVTPEALAVDLSGENNGGFAADITLQMNELRLRREMERKGEPWPFDEPREYDDISDGW